MSHITSVETEIHDRRVLVRALERLGCKWEEDQLVRYHNDRRRMDIVLRNTNTQGVGFGRPRPGEPFRMYNWGSGRDRNRKFEQKVFQEYARLKVLEEARKRNYALVRETVCAGDRIRLVLRKVV